MKVLLDTSVVVAALLPGYASHAIAATWLSRANARAFEFLCSGHSLAEVYAVRTYPRQAGHPAHGCEPPDPRKHPLVRKRLGP